MDLVLPDRIEMRHTVSHVQCRSEHKDGRNRSWNRHYAGPADAEITEDMWGPWKLVSDMTDDEVREESERKRREREENPPKNRWSVAACYRDFPRVPVPDRPGWFKIGAGRLTGYVVRDMFGDFDREQRFGPDQEAEAQAVADEWNRFDRQGPLPPEFEHRRRNLAAVGYRPSYGYDPPVAPERFAVQMYYDDSAYWSFNDNLDAALDANALAVYDLETSEEIEFEVDVRATGRKPITAE